MQQGQRIILRMLEEGKITAAEAEALLNALDDGTSQQETGTQEEPWARVEKMGEDFAAKVEVAVERFARSLEHRTEGFGDKLSKMLAKVPFIGDDTYEFTQVFRGKIGETEDVISVILNNANGPVQVEGWDSDSYQLTVVQRARGKEREQVREDLFSPGWIDGAAKNNFELNVPSQDGVSVSLHLQVPKQLLYQVHLNSHNGSLTVGSLQATTILLRTVNGSSRLYDVTANSIKGEHGNGSCHMDDVAGERVFYKLNNGSYRLKLRAGEVDCITTNGSLELTAEAVEGEAVYKLRSTNGSIRINLPDDSDLGVALDLATSVGKISSQLGSFETIQEERRGGGTALTGRSVNFAERSNQLKLEAVTIAGSIAIGYRNR